jgi:hypothetical protein
MHTPVPHKFFISEYDQEMIPMTAEEAAARALRNNREIVCINDSLDRAKELLSELVLIHDAHVQKSVQESVLSHLRDAQLLVSRLI